MRQSSERYCGLYLDLLNFLWTQALSKLVSYVKIQNETSNPFERKVGVRQGVALACLLFNIALEKVGRDAKLHFLIKLSKL